MDQGRYIFNHIPKSGGISLLAVCRENLRDGEISPHLNEHHIRLVRPERFESYRLIAGHFSLLTQAGFSRSRYSMTLLRDPVRTILSTYNFWRNSPDSDPVTAQAKRLSFDEFVVRFENSPGVINNPYTHHFAAVSRDYPGTPQDAKLLLNIAKSNLSAFNFVGICEEFEASVRLLCRELNWRMPLAVPHENRSRPAQSFEQISPATRVHLAERTRLDSELYAYAKQLFALRCQRSPEHTSLPGGQGGGAGARPDAEIESGANRFIPFPLAYARNREAQIRKVAAEWQAGEAQDTMRITVEYRAGNNTIEDLVAGILLHDADGNVVYGTNTLVENIALRTSQGGEGQVCFVLECELASGLYSITAALAHRWRTGAHYDWVDRATVCEIHARRTHPTARMRLRQIENQ